jgi:ATP-dependent RNA helicase DDX24/MAK5
MQISSREHEHLNDLSQLRFLVMDEADRMVQQASFPQLIHILDTVHQANPMHDESDNDEGEDEDDEDDDDGDDGLDHHRMLGLPGIPGEAKVQMLNDDILKRLEQQQKHSTRAQGKDDDDDDDSGSDGSSNDDEDSNSDAMVPQVNEMEDEEFEQQMKAVAEYNPQDDELSLPLRPPLHRQTFIYSATLTLPSSTSNVQSFRRNNKGKRRGKGGSVQDHANIEGAIAEILEKANAKGKTKVVDLTNMDRGAKHTKSVVVTGKNNNNQETTTTNHSTTGKAATTATTNSTKKTVSSSSSFRLPPGLELQQIKCTQRHKDSHLYGYLMTTKQGLSSGPCLVFCNSIAGVRRVGATLQALGLHDVRILHAQMQQVSAIKLLMHHGIHDIVRLWLFLCLLQ